MPNSNQLRQLYRALRAAAWLLTAASIGAQIPAPHQFGTLPVSSHLPQDADETKAILWADVDGDGTLDLIVGNSGQNRLYLNSGSGIFTDVTATHFPADNDITTSIALCDVDRDGHIDLVIGNARQNKLYRNNGRGVFTDATAGRLPQIMDDTRAIACGDFDGDGWPDIVVANHGQNRLLRNLGDGTFQDVTAVALPNLHDESLSLAVADYDGDGDLDLFFGNFWSGTASRIYINNGFGIFTDESAARLPPIPRPGLPNIFPWTFRDGIYAWHVAAADIDNDGDIDIIFSTPPIHPWYLLPPRQYALINNGNGVFSEESASWLPPWLTGGPIKLHDVDGDGQLDLLVAESFGLYSVVSVLEKAGNSGFGYSRAIWVSNHGSNISCIAIGDANGDAKPDLAIGCASGLATRFNRVLWNLGDGRFSDLPRTALPQTHDLPLSMALGDIDGDGKLDLVLGCYGANRLYRNQGSGRLRDESNLRIPLDIGSHNPTTAVALVDIDGDGALDAIFATSQLGIGSESCELFLNDGSGIFTKDDTGRLPSIADPIWSIAIGDVNGDGHEDIVLGIEGLNRILLNNGAGFFVDATLGRLPLHGHTTHSIVLQDVDGDGDLDMLLHNGGVMLYLNDGRGFFTDVTATHTPGIGALDFAVGDLDGDDIVDLVVNGTTLYLNNGQGIFTEANTGRIPAANEPYYTVALGDINQDGHLDIVAYKYDQSSSPQIRLLLNDGSGYFTDSTATLSQVTTWWHSKLLLGDIDEDGDLDLILMPHPFSCSSELSFYGYCPLGAHPVLLLTNLHRQLHNPHFLQPAHPFRLEVYARNTGPGSVDVAIPYPSTTRIAVPIPSLGTLGITPDAMQGLAVLPQATGVASFTWNVPNFPSLLGLEVFAQALILSTSGSASLTNVTADVMVR